MNNKGFAITGIIYTLFILFLTIVLSVLSGLSISQKLKTNSIENLEDSFEGISVDITEAKTNGYATHNGKYIFKGDDGTNSTFTCSTYLRKGMSLDLEELTFTNKDCNNHSSPMELVEIYSFEEED